MIDINSQIKSQFLKLYNDKSLLIDYLKSLIDNRIVTDFEDIGFCYWNISDSYALLKDGHLLFDNHKSFYDCIKNQDKKYLLWLVCDATQKLTLEHHGYENNWWQIFKEAIIENQDSANHFTLFCAYRAALYKNKTTVCKKQNLDFTVSHFQRFLVNIKSTDEYLFYKTIYLSLISGFLPFNRDELEHLCEVWFSLLSQQKNKSSFLIGEWQSFVTPFDKTKQAEIAINSAINAFINNDELKLAKYLYQNARNFGLNKNLYIEKRLN